MKVVLWQIIIHPYRIVPSIWYFDCKFTVVAHLAFYLTCTSWLNSHDKRMPSKVTIVIREDIWCFFLAIYFHELLLLMEHLLSQIKYFLESFRDPFYLPWVLGRYIYVWQIRVKATGDLYYKLTISCVIMVKQVWHMTKLPGHSKRALVVWCAWMDTSQKSTLAGNAAGFIGTSLSCIASHLYPLVWLLWVL